MKVSVKNSTSATTGIDQVWGDLQIDNIKEHSYKKGVASAQLRQVVRSKYPTVKTTAAGSDTIFGSEEFNLESNDYDNIRVYWLTVPEHYAQAYKTNPEEGKKELMSILHAKAKENGEIRLVRELADTPILTEDDERVYRQIGDSDTNLSDSWDNNPKAFYNHIADRQLIKIPHMIDGIEYRVPISKSGEIVLEDSQIKELVEAGYSYESSDNIQVMLFGNRDAENGIYTDGPADFDGEEITSDLFTEKQLEMLQFKKEFLRYASHDVDHRS